MSERGFSGPLTLDNLQRLADLVWQVHQCDVIALRGNLAMRRQYIEFISNEYRFRPVSEMRDIPFRVMPEMADDLLIADVESR